MKPFAKTIKLLKTQINAEDKLIKFNLIERSSPLLKEYYHIYVCLSYGIEVKNLIHLFYIIKIHIYTYEKNMFPCPSGLMASIDWNRDAIPAEILGFGCSKDDVQMAKDQVIWMMLFFIFHLFPHP